MPTWYGEDYDYNMLDNTTNMLILSWKSGYILPIWYIDGSVQNCRNSSALYINGPGQDCSNFIANALE